MIKRREVTRAAHCFAHTLFAVLFAINVSICSIVRFAISM